MTEPSRYETSDQKAPGLGLPRFVWITGLIVVLAAILVAVIVLASGGHDPSQFNHG